MDETSIILRRSSSMAFASSRYTLRETASEFSMTSSKFGSSKTLSKLDLWHVGTLSPVAGSSTYSIPNLHSISPQYASASVSKSATMLSYTPAALSNSQAARRRLARSNSFIFFSLSAFGTVCFVPQYSHSATVVLSSILRSPPHILHFMIILCSPCFICPILFRFKFYQVHVHVVRPVR